MAAGFINEDVNQLGVANAPGALPAVGRAGIALIFLISGAMKVAAPTTIVGYIAAAGLPFPQLGFAIAAAVELIGGIMLILGYKTRLVAAILAAFCLATAVFFHRSFGGPNMFIHFLKNIAMAGGLLQIVAFGPGRLSVDRR